MQAGGPEHLVVVEPALDIAKGRRVERIQPRLGDPPLANQARTTEHPQVFRDGGPAYREQRSDLAGRPFPTPDRIQDGAPGGIGNGGKDRSFCNHMVT